MQESIEPCKTSGQPFAHRISRCYIELTGDIRLNARRKDDPSSAPEIELARDPIKRGLGFDDLAAVGLVDPVLKLGTLLRRHTS